MRPAGLQRLVELPVDFSRTSPYRSARAPVFARNMVAASQPLAVEAGVRALRAGGNAVDAALAAAITLVVVEPTGNGLGSDAFAILWDGKELHGLNASGRSPQAWSPERFAGMSQMPERGWDSVTVPGAVSAWVDLSRRFGKLAFEDLFTSAIHYAENGFLVSPIIAGLWQSGAELLANQPGFADAFLPGGRPPQAGELFRNPALARSLRAIASTNGEAFYRGELAAAMVADGRRHGAMLSEADLAAHRNDWCAPISQRSGAVELHEIPPNGQGLAALMTLGILDRLGIAGCGVDSVEAVHLQIEAMKLAFADTEAYVSDPQFMTAVTAEDLLSPGYLDSRARLIDRQRAQDFRSGAPTAGGTVCLAAADEAGMMVSFIQSNYKGFGSGVVVPNTGISLQNRGCGFTLSPGHPNGVAGGKRPFHTIIPGFVMQAGQPLTAFGLMGGPMQAQGHVQMVLRMETWGQDPQTAADAPRWQVISGRRVLVEPEFDVDVLASLGEMGHDIAVEPGNVSFGFGGAQIVRRIPGGYVGGSDPRKDGHVGGY